MREDQEPPPCLAGFYGLGEEMGSRANVLVDRAEPQAEQGLREADGHERGVRLRGYEPPKSGEEIGSLMRLFRQFLTAGCGDIDPYARHAYASG